MNNFGFKLVTIIALALFVSGSFIPMRAAETNAPALIIYTTGGYPRVGATNSGPQISAALWPDGKIVWSEAGIEGGAPLRQGKFAPERLTALMDKIASLGAFTNTALKRIHYGPDSRYTCIRADDGRRKLQLQSWHELFEQKTNLIVTTHGVEILGNRDRAKLQAEQPEDYRQFRNLWSEIRAQVAAVTPKTGEPFAGEIAIPRK